MAKETSWWMQALAGLVGAVVALALFSFVGTFDNEPAQPVPTAAEIAALIPAPIIPTAAEIAAEVDISGLEFPDTIITERDAHEDACLALAEKELERTSFLKDLADELDIDDWRDIDDVTYRDFDVSGFSRSDVRNGDCEVTLERVRVNYDGDELEKGDLTFTIEDDEVDDDETEFDF